MKLLDNGEKELSEMLVKLEQCEIDPAIEADNRWREIRNQFSPQTSANEDLFQEWNKTQKALAEGEIKLRNLRSFVDEDSIIQLRENVSEKVKDMSMAIRQNEELIIQIQDVISRFSKDVSSYPQIPLTQHNKEATTGAGADSGNKQQQQQQSTISSSITRKELEEAYDKTNEIAIHAHAMAMLLESLTHHYDQCCQALQMEKELTDMATTRNITNTEGRLNATPVTDEQLAVALDAKKEDLVDLMQVLENDSSELEVVVDELQERYADISTLSGQVSQYEETLMQAHQYAVSLFDRLEQFGSVMSLPQKKSPEQQQDLDTKSFPNNNLHTLLTMFQENQILISEATEEMETKLITEMENLKVYYRLFLQSYHKVLIEIDRRKTFQRGVEKYLSNIRSHLNYMLVEELKIREDFVQDISDFFPKDLWPGVLDPPPFFEIITNNMGDEFVIKEEGGGGGDGDDENKEVKYGNLPNISPKNLQAAINEIKKSGLFIKDS